MQPMSHQSQFHSIHQSHHHQPIHQSQHASHFPSSHHCGSSSNLPDLAHSHHSSPISQHMACLQPLNGGHVGGRLHIMVRIRILILYGFCNDPKVFSFSLLIRYKSKTKGLQRTISVHTIHQKKKVIVCTLLLVEIDYKFVIYNYYYSVPSFRFF